MSSLDNANPAVFETAKDREVLPEEEDDDVKDKIDAREVFDILHYVLPTVSAICICYTYTHICHMQLSARCIGYLYLVHVVPVS